MARHSGIQTRLRRSSNIVQCDNCGTWSDAEFYDGRKSNAFQRCAGCKKVYCELLFLNLIDQTLLCNGHANHFFKYVYESDCSRECQKKRWKTHKEVCISS